jgi:hypothetical protein
MSENEDKFVTTLIFPNEYTRHFNQVAGLTTRNIVFLKRKFVSKAGYELVSYPLADCVNVTYKDERPIGSIVFGALLLIVLAVIAYGLYEYWDSLPSETRIPVGLLLLGPVIAFRWVFSARRHRLIFTMRDGSKLTWKTRAGDYKYKEAGAAKAVELAKSLGILVRPAISA